LRRGNGGRGRGKGWEKWVFLAQTDTTAGLLSRDKEKLNRLKGRPPSQPVLREVASLEVLTRFVRVPPRFQREVRRLRKVTYIYGRGGEGVRVVDSGPHHRFLKRWEWLYSTSANPTGGKFDRGWAEERADIVVEDWRGIFEAPSSQIFILGRRQKRRVR